MRVANPLARLFGPALIISVLWAVLFWGPATGARSDAAAVRDAGLTNLLEQQTELAIARREPVDEIELLAVLASSTAAVPEDANLAGVIDLLH